jgi:hypothetical protein
MTESEQAQREALETQPLESKTLYHLDTVDGPRVVSLEGAIRLFSLPETTSSEDMSAYVARHRRSGMRADESVMPVYVLKDDTEYTAQVADWEWESVIVRRVGGKNQAIATQTVPYSDPLPIPAEGSYTRALTNLFNWALSADEQKRYRIEYVDASSITYSVTMELPDYLYEYTIEEALRDFSSAWISEVANRVRMKNVETLVPDDVLDESDRLSSTDLAIAKAVVQNTGTEYTLAERVALAREGIKRDPIVGNLFANERALDLSRGYIRAGG